MKKLVLLSLAVGMFSVSFADGVKLEKQTTPVRAKAFEQSSAMTTVATKIVTRTSTKPAKSIVKDKISSATGRTLLGVTFSPMLSFGVRNVAGPCVSYNPDLGLIATNVVLAEAVPEENSDGITTSYSTDRGSSFEDVLFSAPESGKLGYVQSAIYVPAGVTKLEDVYTIAEGAYADASGTFTGQAFMAKTLFASAEKVSVSNEASDPSKILSQAVYRSTAINPHDNTAWTILPNLDRDGDNYKYTGSVNILKGTIAADGTASTDVIQIAVPADFIGGGQLAWSVDGKYGVYGWVGTSEDVVGFMQDQDIQYAMYIFSSDYGVTWSAPQNMANMCGPDGISSVVGYWVPEILATIENYTPETARISMNWLNFDVAIDRWGNLYFGGGMMLNGKKPLEYYAPVPNVVLYSAANSEADNAATNIRPLTNAVMLDQQWIPLPTDPTKAYIFGTSLYGNKYGTGDTKPIVGPRFQFSQDKNGAKLFAFWNDKTFDAKAQEQEYPELDIYGMGWNLETNKFALVVSTKPAEGTEIVPITPYNFTNGTDAQGENHFLCVADKMIHGENGWEASVVSTEVYELGIVDGNSYYYVGGISMNDEDFAVLKRNKTPIVDKGTIPADNEDPSSPTPKPPIGVNDVEALAPMNLYPNPAVNEINIDVEGEASIYNVAGQLLKTIQVSDGRVDISNLPAGAMIIKAEGKAPQKFIKK